MIETLQIILQLPIELRVIILAVPICFLTLNKRKLYGYKEKSKCTK